MPTFPVFSPFGIPPMIAQPVTRGFTQVQAFLRKGHNRDGTSKQIVNWTAVTYRAGLFSGGGTQTWTVDASDFGYLRYHVCGNLMTYRGSIVGSDVGGTPDVELRVNLPDGWLIIGAQAVGYLLYSDAGGARAVGVAVATPNTRYVSLQKAAVANWTGTAADDTTVHFNIAFEVTQQ